MISWTAVEDALQTWVSVGSGIPSARVVWSRTRPDRPTPPYIAMRVMSIRKVGQDWLTVHDNPDPDPGEEIVHTVRGRREITLALQCFDAAGTGIGSAESLLEAVMQSVRLPSVHAGLRAAGVGVATFGNVIALDSGMIGAQRFETRATLDVRLFVSSEVAEFTTFIERVEVERTTPLPLITFVVDRDD